MKSVDRLVDALRQNPESLLLVGAGIALLLREAKSMRSSANGGPNGEAESEETNPTGKRPPGQAAAGKAVRSAKSAGAKARAATKRARRSIEKAVGAQPAAVALAGAATGCLMAAIAPASRLEKSTLRPVGRLALDAAEKASRELKDRAVAATASASEHLVKAVATGVLEKGGAANLTREVATEFKRNMAERPSARDAP